MVINYKKLNPNGFYLLKYLNDVLIRFIILFGGSSSGKSFSVAQAILIQTLQDEENTLVMRKVGASISKTIYEDFKVAAKELNIDKFFKFQQNSIKCLLNVAKIDFCGLDDPEKIKGISNYKRVLLEEWTEFDENDFKQIRKRLRGKRGQQIVCTFNPISESHWIKKKVFDVEKWHDVPMSVEFGGKVLPKELTQVKSLRMNESKFVLNPRTKEFEEHAPDMVLIQSTYLNNFWVVGSPDGTYGYYDEQCIADFERDKLLDPDYYNVYALGEFGVIRTGSEFFSSLHRGKHCGDFPYNPNLPIHISVDSNVLPYISVTYWQVDFTNGIEIHQFHETCADNPNNTARKSAKLVCDYLHSIGYNDKLYLHGDASTKSANNIDEEKRSFLDLFIDTLQKSQYEVVDTVSNKNPSVAMSGEFINAIFEGAVPGIKIHFDNCCNVSLEDYMSVQKDANGAILKTRIKNKVTMQTYEEHGHLSDTFRYVVVDLCKNEFISFSNKRKRNLYTNSLIKYFNPNTECSYTSKVLYVLPNINGMFVLIEAYKCGDKWHIVSVKFRETTSVDEIKQAIETATASMCIIECADAYFPFVRELRATSNKEIRVCKEVQDIDKRIAATSDFVRSNIEFSETQLAEQGEYELFMSNLMDYRKDGESKEASAALSGLIQFVVKLF